MDPDALYYDLITAMNGRKYDRAKEIAALLLDVREAPVFHTPETIRAYCRNVLAYY